MDSQFIITVRFGRIQSFPISNDRRKIPNRGFVAVQEHDENCALLYGVFIFGEKMGHGRLLIFIHIIFNRFLLITLVSHPRRSESSFS